MSLLGKVCSFKILLLALTTLFFFLSEDGLSALSPKKPYLGIDVGAGATSADLRYKSCATCAETQEYMISSSPSLALYWDKLLAPKYQWGVLFLDYGATVKFRSYSQSTDLDKNDVSTTSYAINPDGSVTTIRREAPHRIKLQLLGLDPTVYFKTGLAIPYLPYLVFTSGIGYPLLAGYLTYDASKSQVFGHTLNFSLEMELVLLRLSRFWGSLFISVAPTVMPLKMSTKGVEARNYQVNLGQTDAGIRFLIKAW